MLDPVLAFEPENEREKVFLVKRLWFVVVKRSSGGQLVKKELTLYKENNISRP